MIVGHLLLERGDQGVDLIVSSGGRTLLHGEPRTTRVPFVGVDKKVSQRFRPDLLPIDGLVFGLAVHRLVNAAVFQVDLLVVVTLARVGPIANVQASIGAVLTTNPRNHSSLAKRKSGACLAT